MRDALLLGALAITVPVCYHAIATMLMPGRRLISQYAQLLVVILAFLILSWVLGRVLLWLPTVHF